MDVIRDITSSFQVPTISMFELRKGIGGGKIKLVDVRSERERKEFDIGGFHIALNDLADFIEYFEEKFTYVFYCSSGKRSEEAVRLLRSESPCVRTMALKDGIGEWLK